MRIDSIEELEDRVKITYTLYQYYAKYDTPEFKEVLYKDVPNLPKDTEEYRKTADIYNSFESRTVFLSKINRSIGFVIGQCQEPSDWSLGCVQVLEHTQDFECFLSSLSRKF